MPQGFGRGSVLVLFVGAHVVNDFYVTVLPAFLPALAEEFDLDYTELGVLSFAFTLFSGILQPLIGNRADRLGRHRFVLTAGFAVGAVGFLAMASAPTFWFIVAVSLLCGLGGATYHPQATVFLVHAYPEARGRTLGLHGWGGSVGHFLAPAVVVLAVSVFDWRLSMVGIAVPLFLMAALLRTNLAETSPTPGATLRGAASPHLVLVAVTFGIIAMVGRSFLTFAVKMLVDEGWQETRAGVVLTVILLVGAIAQPLGGRIYDQIGGRSIFTAASSGLAAFTAVFALTSGALSLIAVAGVAFCMFALFPVSLALASKLGGDGRTGAATGMVFGVTGLMTATAQPAVGAIGEGLGDIRAALAWLLPLTLLAVVLARRIADSPRRADVPTG